jgi:hypothetical protein
MSSNKQDQAARRKATQDVIAENRALFEERMRHYYEEMGLGEWKPRLSAEERAAKKAEAEKQATAAKIHALAEKAGIGVLIVEDPDIQQKLDDVVSGVTTGGVTVDWDDEEPDSEPEPETDDQRDERLAIEADRASQSV